MKEVQRQGNRLAYRELGEGPKALVLVHGWMVDGTVYDDLIEALNLDGWRLLVPDLRGAGASDACDDYELDRYVDDVMAVVDDANADRFVVVGHSMGGQIAQLVASRHAERVDGLVLLCPVPASGMQLPEDAHELFYNSGENREAQKIILDTACLDLGEGAQKRLLDGAEKIPASCIRAAYDAWTGGGFEEELDAITAETLVVGSDDPFLPPSFLKSTVVEPIEKAEFVHIAGAGHYVLVERPKMTAQKISQFLKTL